MVSDLYGRAVTSSLDEAGVAYEVADVGGDSTHEESGRVREIIVSNNCDLAVGIGSGKVLDTSKASEPKLESDL